MPRDFEVYLADILEAIDRIGRYTTGMRHETFAADQKTIDAVVRNLEVIGEAVKSLLPALRSQYPTMEWQKIAGLRDILIHAYFGVDIEIVWDVVETKLPGLKTTVESMLAK